MIDYSLILSTKYVGAEWSLNNNEYESLQWFSNTPKPTQEELDALWRQAQYESQCAAVEQARLVAYEQTSDPLYFKWQRGDATEAEWREAVAKVKLDNPYPPAP
jgi:hypothetical protein